MATEAPTLAGTLGQSGAISSASRRRWFSPPAGYKWRRQTTFSFLLFHALLSLACVPWLFSWAGVIAAFLGYYVFNTVGIDLCYHRLLTHRSFKVPLWLERTVAILGVCSLQDSPCQWAATHRRHHRHADDHDDPHSPLRNMFWGHMGWLIVKENDPHRGSLQKRYVADMLRDPFYCRVEKNMLWLWIFLAHAVLFYVGGFVAGFALSGTIIGGVQLGSSMFVWGVIVRLVYSWHATWSVNSAGHLWGYRNYNTKDNSRNNWMISMLTNGGCWHNNHHGDQRSAAHGHHRWWELDLAYLTIRALEFVGLAWDVTPRRRLHLLLGRQDAGTPQADVSVTLPFENATKPSGDNGGERARAA